MVISTKINALANHQHLIVILLNRMAFVCFPIQVRLGILYMVICYVTLFEMIQSYFVKITTATFSTNAIYFNSHPAIYSQLVCHDYNIFSQ